MARAPLTKRGIPGQRCEHCDGVYAKSYMRTHVRETHGIRLRGPNKTEGVSPKQKRGRQKRSKAIVPLPIEKVGELEVVTPAVMDHPTNGATTFTPLPFVVLEHSDGSLWFAEKVFEGDIRLRAR